MNSRRRDSIFVCFIYQLEEKNSKSEVIFAVCRLPLTDRLSMTFTANMKLLPSLFSCVYSRVKLFVFAMNSRRRYHVPFLCALFTDKKKRTQNQKLSLPSAVNVMLNLSIVFLIKTHFCCLVALS